MRSPGLASLLGVVFLTMAVAKLFAPNYLCANPFDAANHLMMIVEFIAGLGLLHRDRRRFSAILLAALMVGAMGFLTFARSRGYDPRMCGCFGPLKMPFAAHLVVAAVLAVACAVVFAAEERRLRARTSASAG